MKTLSDPSELFSPLRGLIVDHRNEIHPDELEQADEFAHVPALIRDAQRTCNSTDLIGRRRTLQAFLDLRGSDL
ncbi:hypothetical protein ACFWIF_10755, partial [Corynebacterium bovis]|uniref:hypothetical protein n=1 Tax=Corynebacterium bovis TaxID=36808 RepID=UPI00367DE992